MRFLETDSVPGGCICIICTDSVSYCPILQMSQVVHRQVTQPCPGSHPQQAAELAFKLRGPSLGCDLNHCITWGKRVLK